MATSPKPAPHGRGGLLPGFTLIELLTACAVLALLTIILVSLAGHGTKLWSLTESQNQCRQRARALLEFAAADLRQAVVPLDGSTNSLQFIISPPSLPAASFHDSIFWQAPIANDSSSGDLAEIGYFVRWTTNGTTPQSILCRFFVNPSEGTNYLIHTDPANWLSSSTVAAVAPADQANNYKGLFLENVLGLWVKAYASDGTPYPTGSQPYFDSRATNGTNAVSSARRLPAYVDLSLVVVDNSTAKRISAADAAVIQSAVQSASSAGAFMTNTSLPKFIRNNCSAIGSTVNLANSR
ncbi:hypothetical protein BH09VER1_BH09VER1_07400 [soil metagenome]